MTRGLRKTYCQHQIIYECLDVMTSTCICPVACVWVLWKKREFTYKPPLSTLKSQLVSATCVCWLNLKPTRQTVTSACVSHFEFVFLTDAARSSMVAPVGNLPTCTVHTGKPNHVCVCVCVSRWARAPVTIGMCTIVISALKTSGRVIYFMQSWL